MEKLSTSPAAAGKAHELQIFFEGRELPPSKKIVCPFGIEAAQKNTILYAHAPSLDEPEAVRQNLYQAIRKYRRNPERVLVVIAPEDEPNHDLSRITIYQLFAELGLACEHEENTGQPLPEIKKRWRETILTRLLSDPQGEIAGTIGQQERHNVIAMGPCFDPTHPRYAPHLILVVIRFAEIIAVGQGDGVRAARSIQHSMHDRLRALGLVTVIDAEGRVVILDNELYPARAIQIDEERYEQRIRNLMGITQR